MYKSAAGFLTGGLFDSELDLEHYPRSIGLSVRQSLDEMRVDAGFEVGATQNSLSSAANKTDFAMINRRAYLSGGFCRRSIHTDGYVAAAAKT